jgi:hypothetical protein
VTHALTDSDRARARETVQAERERRVDAVLDLMSRGEWDGMRSHRALAKEWSCSLGAVQDYAREAYGISRKLMLLTPEQKEDARAHYAATLRKNAERAAEAEDFNAVNRAIELQMRLTGVLEPDTTVNVAVQVAQLDEAALSRHMVAGLMARPDRLAILASALGGLDEADRAAVIAEAARTVTVDAAAPDPEAP